MRKASVFRVTVNSLFSSRITCICPNLLELFILVFIGIGSASHLGVILDVPCVGVAKNLFCMENEIERDEQHKEQVHVFTATFIRLIKNHCDNLFSTDFIVEQIGYILYILCVAYIDIRLPV